MSAPMPADLARFAEVEHWVFDLDNTLYPAHTRLFDQIDRRIGEYVSRLLGVEAEEAHRIQKDYYRRHGTTLSGLMSEHGITPDDFLDYVHDIDHSPVERDPRLGAAIAALPGHCYIFTNGSRRHAEKVIERLGVTRPFAGIFDIVAADLKPKPGPEPYARFIAEHAIAPERAAMFEDLSRNLKEPKRLGMATTLIVPRGTREVFREDWELEGRDAAHIDFVTDHLADFLTGIVTFLAAGTR